MSALRLDPGTASAVLDDFDERVDPARPEGAFVPTLSVLASVQPDTTRITLKTHRTAVEPIPLLHLNRSPRSDDPHLSA